LRGGPGHKGHAVNDHIAKLEAKLAGIVAEQKAALVAAEADGVTDDDRAKHLAEFDRLDGEKAKAKASLERAKRVSADESAAARDKAESARVAAELDLTPEVPPVVTAPVRNTLVSPRPGQVTIPANVIRGRALKAFKGPDAEQRAYQTGLWVAARMYNHGPSIARVRELGIEGPSATLNGLDNNKGGYFVPNVMTMAVIELQELYGVIRRLADVEQMTSETWAGPRWTNNMVAYWVSQGNSPTQSEPGWDRVELVAKDLAAFGKQTVQLSEDALIDLGDKWAMAAAVAFSYAEDNAGFNGDGTSTYGGITGLFQKIIASANSASLSTATGHTTLGALTMADYAAVVGKFPNYPGANPVWLCHKEVWANSMLTLQMAAGGVTATDIQEGGKPRFLGYPVEFVNVAPKASAVTTGVTGILFGDLAMAVKFGDRRQRMLRTAEISDDVIKQLITMFAASRVDINVHTVVDPKDSTLPGPVIGLKLG
jgi:HK97 family phage major capsid protein